MASTSKYHERVIGIYQKIIIRDAINLAKTTLSKYEKQKGLEIVDSHTYKMGDRFVRVENITDDGRVGLILLLKAHYKEEDSWIVFYPTDKDRKALKKFLKLLDDRILYNKRAFWSFYKNNGGNK